MDLTAWLDAEKGRSAALAAHFNVTPAAVSQWKKNGVPLGNMKAVRDFTKGAVGLEEMVPDSMLPGDVLADRADHASAAPEPPADAPAGPVHMFGPDDARERRRPESKLQREIDRVTHGLAEPQRVSERPGGRNEPRG